MFWAKMATGELKEIPVRTGLMEQMEQMELHLLHLLHVHAFSSTVVRQATTQLQALHREGQRGLRQGKHHSSGKGCRVTSSGQP